MGTSRVAYRHCCSIHGCFAVSPIDQCEPAPVRECPRCGATAEIWVGAASPAPSVAASGAVSTRDEAAA
jgi:hypothetical protein